MPALAARIAEEMKAALLGGDRFRGEVLRNLKAALLNEEVALGKREAGLEDAEVEKVLAREVKKRLESAELYRANGRAELAEPEEQEAAVLREFLPQQLSEAELRALVQQVIDTMGEVSMQQMGQVIGAVKAKVGNAADGAMIANIVKETLNK
ncbi:MAG: GatB/YqeY domain-containing protein [Candidatus Saccharibacteria bacterium]|nr:GatB/YqeY domain-containing protein [Candidatus Saccharibacteria bacterium]